MQHRHLVADIALTARELQQLDGVATTINVHGARGTGQESYA